MVNEEPFPPLPDPWADGREHTVLMFPIYWNNPNPREVSASGREPGVVSFGPASYEEIGAYDRLKIQVPSAATPVFLNARQVNELIEYLQSGQWRSR